MSTLNGPGWVHESDTSGESHGTPQGALMAWLRHVRGCCDDDNYDREVQALDRATHVVLLMAACTLTSEEEREAAMAGIDDEEFMADLPIGGTYYQQVRGLAYVTTVEESGDEEGGALTISYVRRGKT